MVFHEVEPYIPTRAHLIPFAKVATFAAAEIEHIDRASTSSAIDVLSHRSLDQVGFHPVADSANLVQRRRDPVLLADEGLRFVYRATSLHVKLREELT